MRALKRFFLLVACAMVGILLLGSAGPGAKTFKRIHDPLVVDCKNIKPFLGVPINRVTLMAFKGGKWAPIPFQIDQKKPDGSYAFETGPGASKDPDPNIDANDELVLMVKDCEDKAVSGKWPGGAKKIVEIELTDPKNGKKGWLYMMEFPGKAPRSKEDYIMVKVDKAKKYRKVITYEYEMGGPTNMPFPDYMRALNKPGGGMGTDVLDRIKTRGDVILFAGIKIPYKMDSMTRVKDVGYIDGPVRVLHYGKGYLEFTKGIKMNVEGHSLISYYVNHVIWPMEVTIPRGARKFIKDFTATGYMDFCPGVYGSYSFNKHDLFNKNIVFDGKMSDAEKKMNRKDENYWQAGFGPQGALINRMYILPKNSGVKLYTYYLDDKTVKDPPEDCPGISAIGYEFVGMAKPKTTVTVLQYYYFLSRLKPQEIHTILDILDKPVKVKVKKIK